MSSVSVLFTCDVECSLGNRGSFRQPDFHPWSVAAMIWGRIDGGRRCWGIPLLMKQLERRGMRGTFFLSALQAAYHRVQDLAQVAQEIEARGHEAGVHLHCAWSGFDRNGHYDLSAGYHLNDSIAQHDAATQQQLIGRAVDDLGRWTGKQPVSFRAGNYGANRTTLKVLSRLGLGVDSSCNAAVGSLSSFGRYNAPAKIENILEIPITVFEAVPKPWCRLNFVDPSNMTVGQVQRILDQIVALGIGTLVLVTHSFQYLKPGHVSGARFYPRPKIVARVERILDLIAADPRCRPMTMREFAAGMAAEPPLRDGLPKVPLWTTITKQLQGLRDRFELPPR